MTTRPMGVLIAGASGYIGRALIPKLLEILPNVEITALSRRPQESDDRRVKWLACDLFDFDELRRVLPERVERAFYLVHSMGPTAHLDQGSFADYDLILADNFARAIRERGIQQLVYLGGLIPEKNNLSLHLESRLEVEQTFKSHHLPLTVFRAALILGQKGSSFQILLKLVRRLPIMVCPKWTRSKTTPVDLESVVQALSQSLVDAAHLGRTYDLAACQPLSYLEMMRLTANDLGLRRIFLTVPLFTPALSRLWVSLVTNSPKRLVYPLIESLKHEMVAKSSKAFPGLEAGQTYKELLSHIQLKTYKSRKLFKFSPQRRTVRSVQRLPLPKGKNAAWIRLEYFRWLPELLAPLVQVYVAQESVRFCLLHPKLVFLELTAQQVTDTSDRQCLNISQGLLVAKNNQGFLEFREVLGGRFVLAAIHKYRPCLPWFVYVWTQAKIHLWVMRKFAQHLRKFCDDKFVK